MGRLTGTVCIAILLFAVLLPASGGANDPGPGLHKFQLTIRSTDRDYLVHIPRDYDAAHPVPLVIMLHGGGERNNANDRGFSIHVNLCLFGVHPR